MSGNWTAGALAGIFEHAGWRSRGYLPHCDASTLVQHVVFGLHDALPADVVPLRTAKERFLWSERELDAGHGERLLADSNNATLVEACLLHDDGNRYSLIAWCIMPTHVHVLAAQSERERLADIVQAWKSISAHRINRLQSRKGPVWRREYFDRFMRTDQQFNTTLAYVENNPVAARLAARPEDWRFSSAWWRKNAGGGAGGPV
ncbi:MAG: transposase [Proteobacteria bacterium]|nr:transposase [Pseudomonadota bacterium]